MVCRYKSFREAHRRGICFVLTSKEADSCRPGDRSKCRCEDFCNYWWAEGPCDSPLEKITDVSAARHPRLPPPKHARPPPPPPVPTTKSPPPPSRCFHPRL